jgi:hypothetical protein
VTDDEANTQIALFSAVIAAALETGCMRGGDRDYAVFRRFSSWGTTEQSCFAGDLSEFLSMVEVDGIWTSLQVSS